MSKSKDSLPHINHIKQWPHVLAVTGALGSGKTEFVLNLASALKKQGESVVIADADIINPYFCIRQVAQTLEEEGFTVLTPPEAAKWSDMSVLNPAISKAIIDDSRRLILDVGGDAVGVRALIQFAPDLIRRECLLLLVVNAFRPQTNTPELVDAMRRKMEALCGLKVGALVSNCHLMDRTTPQDVVQGLEIVVEAGQLMNLPVTCAMVDPSLLEGCRSLLTSGNTPLWPLERFMRRPWEGESMWSSPSAPLT
ncbi:MAG: hypothetical protein GX256_10460 [Fretibacterium sp.]|nr:hypothetical protein [Fretibacterium sp.]